ncbi:MAG: hypothetical protein AM326_09860 [Candidatus Thorarchaeota archaeon SMTZ-45]|nr:MAG: hypothetical protein AM326_09860 [Candidatus Thorarchaeota archaeon SMTZ-45]
MEVGIVYFTDNRCEERIVDVCRRQILRCTDMSIVSVSHYPIDFGKNIVVDLPRSTKSLFTQILIGAEENKADILFLCEHDVLYSPGHFEARPNNRKFFYNLNRWAVDWRTGHALYRYSCCTSLCVARRESILNHFSKLLKLIEEGGYHRSRHGFAPGTHRIPGVCGRSKRTFSSKVPCVDIRHATNFTPNRWKKKQFRNPHSIKWWKESDGIPGWGKTEGRFDDFIREVDEGKLPKEVGEEK